MIPQDFESWKICIEEKCGIPLTKDFAAKRLAVYEDKEQAETRRFAALYGQQHLDNVLSWFRKIHAQELS